MATKIIIQTNANESTWTSATDLMAGLMIIFLFISISFIQHASKVAEDWIDKKEIIYKSLQKEFKKELKSWDAQIIKETLVIRFNKPTVLFKLGSSVLTDKFKDILKNFFPRYTNLLYQFSDDISEIRIEGHTSSEWFSTNSDEDKYFLNMRLSHDRTREVLIFCLKNLHVPNKKYHWIRNNLIGAGFSSSKLVLNKMGKEDFEASRRVEFRILTNADKKLSSIIKEK